MGHPLQQTQKGNNGVSIAKSNKKTDMKLGRVIIAIYFKPKRFPMFSISDNPQGILNRKLLIILTQGAVRKLQFRNISALQNSLYYLPFNETH